jgi:hypothetical protein
MSDLLTHWAVCEDGLNLLAHDPRIEPIFKAALIKEPVMARYGAIVRTESFWVLERLKEARKYSADALNTRQARHVSFIAAALTHTACDNLMKPSYQKVILAEEEMGNVPTGLAAKEMQRDVYAYQDTFVYKEVLGDGQREPLGRHMFADIDNPASKALNEAAGAVFSAGMLELREMYRDFTGFDREVVGGLLTSGLKQMIANGNSAPRACGSRGLARQPFVEWMAAAKIKGTAFPVKDLEKLVDEVLPLLVPDANDPLARLDHRLCGVPWLYVQHHRLEDAYNRRSDDKEQRYKIFPEFYAHDDPILQLARAAQRGEAIDADKLIAASEQSVNRSYYGQAVALALIYIGRAGAVVRGETDEFKADNYADYEFVNRMRQKAGGRIFT